MIISFSYKVESCIAEATSALITQPAVVGTDANLPSIVDKQGRQPHLSCDFTDHQLRFLLTSRVWPVQ